MHARNLGVVFGREYPETYPSRRCTDDYLFNVATLMRSPDPGAEFSDMAGKALCIEWLVENALRVFDQQSL